MSLDRHKLETPGEAIDRLVPSPEDDRDDPLAIEGITDERATKSFPDNARKSALGL